MSDDMSKRREKSERERERESKKMARCLVVASSDILKKTKQNKGKKRTDGKVLTVGRSR